MNRYRFDPPEDNSGSLIVTLTLGVCGLIMGFLLGVSPVGRWVMSL